MGNFNYRLTPVVFGVLAMGLNGCSVFGPYSSTPSFAAGEKPSFNITQITSGDSPVCSADNTACKNIGKLILVPPSASMSVQVLKGDDVITCASPAEVAKALSSSGAGSLSVPTDAGKAAVAIGASGTATEAITLTQSTDVASHYVAAASFYNCLGYASGYINPDSANQNQANIIAGAVQIALAAAKSASNSTPTTNDFQIGGVIVGLKGAGLVLTDSGADDLSVAATAQTFTFDSKLAKDKSYKVAVKTNPAAQTCSVTGNASGTVSGDVKNVVITCS